MKKEIMSKEKLAASLAISDLSDPANGIHAVNLMLEKLRLYFVDKTKNAGWPMPEIRRSSPITSIENNFDRLLFPVDNATRSSIYTRYISEDLILRGHTASIIPDILEGLPSRNITDYLVFCPGICYRRDIVDKVHCGEPHQLDIWRIRKGEPRFGRKDLIELVEAVIDCAIPGYEYKIFNFEKDIAKVRTYVQNGFKVKALTKNSSWLSFLECGEVHPTMLANLKLDPKYYCGLAVGVILDRLVMIAKGIDDIRAMRSNDTRVKKQMLNLEPFRSVSKYPPVRQDLSFSVAEEKTEEDICESIRTVLGNKSDILEEVSIRSETTFNDLPPQAIQRLGIKPGQKNILVRITLRSHDRSLLQEEANEIRNEIYKAVNESGTEGYLA